MKTSCDCTDMSALMKKNSDLVVLDVYDVSRVDEDYDDDSTSNDSGVVTKCKSKNVNEGVDDNKTCSVLNIDSVLGAVEVDAVSRVHDNVSTSNDSGVISKCERNNCMGPSCEGVVDNKTSTVLNMDCALGAVEVDAFSRVHDNVSTSNDSRVVSKCERNNCMGPSCEGVYDNEPSLMLKSELVVVEVDDISSDDDSDDDDSDDDDSDDDDDEPGDLDIVARNQESGNFGNKVVKNSRDVNFGNRTVYQCPVTIRQVVYAGNRDHRIRNVNYLPGLDTAPGVNIEIGDLSQSTRSQTPELHSQEGNKVQQNNRDLKTEEEEAIKANCHLRRRYVVWITTAGVVAILTAATLVFMLPAAPTKDETTPTLRIHQRVDWSAKPEEDSLPLRTPVPYVMISHTVQSNCSNLDDCGNLVRIAQDLHLSNGWGDVGYNFLVGGDGYAYVGRGWDNVGAHTIKFNSCSIGIAFIGTFSSTHPPRQQMDAALLLIAKGVRLGKIRPDYRLLGQRQVSSSESPGNALFEDLKKLSHFSEKALSCAVVETDMNAELKVQVK